MSIDRREYMRAYHAATREKASERSRKRRAERGDELREYSRRYYQTHKEKWQNAPVDSGRKVAAAARWKARNPEAVRLAGHLRRVALRSARPVTLTSEKIAARRAYLGERCWICGETERLTWDHVKPITMGGSHLLANLRLACVSCNSRKGGRWPGVSQLAELVEYLNLNKVNGAAFQGVRS